MKKKEKLPKRFKDKWVKMLRSGKYQQTKKNLFDGEGYCCLGISCLAAGYKNEEIRGKLIIESKFNKVPSLLIGTAMESKVIEKLCDFNDNKDWTFKKIASYIERYL